MGNISPWAALDVLLSPKDEPSRRPIEMLRRGDRAAALTLASRAAAQATWETVQPQPQSSCSYLLRLARGAMDAMVDLASRKASTISDDLLRDRPVVQTRVAQAHDNSPRTKYLRTQTGATTEDVR